MKTILIAIVAVMMIPSVQADPVLDQLKAEWPSVNAEIAAATADANQLEPAYQLYFSWAVRSQPYAELTPERTEGQTGLAHAVSAAVSRDHADCVASHDADQAAKILGLIQWAEQKPEVASAPGFDLGSLQTQAAACANFDLWFESSMTIQTSSGPIHLSTVAQFPLHTEVAGDHFMLTGSGTLDYDEIVYPSDNQCTITSVGSSGTMVVPSSTLETILAPGGESISAVQLNLMIPSMTEKTTISCPNGSRTVELRTWFGGWVARHHDEISNGGYLVSGWTLLHGQKFAKRTYTGTGPDPITEDTTLTLVHAPR